MGQLPTDMNSLLMEIDKSFETRGYHYYPDFSDPHEGSAALLLLARRMGNLDVPDRIINSDPIVTTRPTARATMGRPFDKPESLGWHNDFSSNADRPEVSLAFIARPDPLGADHGAWRVASVDHVLRHLVGTPSGRSVLRFLLDTPIPFSFARPGPPTLHRVLEPRGGDPGRYKMRFYGRAVRFGLRWVAADQRAAIEDAAAAIEGAADHVGEQYPASAGALLVVHNSFCLHDRTVQTVTGRLRRQSLLCFVRTADDTRPLAPFFPDDEGTGGPG